MENHKFELGKLLKILIACFFILILLFISIYFLEKNSPSEIFSALNEPADTRPISAITLKDSVRLIFVGDIMLDRSVARAARKNGRGDIKKGADSIFREITPLFYGKDIIVGNLEGTITSNESVAEKDNSILHFTFDPVFADALASAGFSAFSLANNHALDFGPDGLAETKENLRRVRVGFFGSPLNEDGGNSDLSWSKVVRGKNFCFVGYHDLFTENPETAIQEIQRIRANCEHITIFTHWGEEYAQRQNERQTILAHSFIDAGADLIIGAHPHVVQPYEVYKNKAIFYSLGNFIFDQDFSFETMHGLAVDVELIFKSKTVSKSRFKMIPIVIDDGVASINSENSVEVLDLTY